MPLACLLCVTCQLHGVPASAFDTFQSYSGFLAHLALPLKLQGIALLWLHWFRLCPSSRTCLEDVRVHGADSILQHGVLVLAVKVVKEMYIVQRILALHGKVNAVLAQYHIFFLQTSRKVIRGGSGLLSQAALMMIANSANICFFCILNSVPATA